AWFESNGEVGLASPDALASSIRGMDHMVRTMLNQTQVPLADVIRMATLTPAERVKMDGQIGSLEVGKVADLLVLDQEFNIEKVYLGGQEIPKLV
ncbi:MAG: amidohydrolase family protein, partial [Rubripirellula sp.]|nr:amidohydrolase family protein [Rubripirellula sp.]